MQPYQEEYISNLKAIIKLTEYKKQTGCSFLEYQEEMLRDRWERKEKTERNMQLLREELFPLLDNLFDASKEELAELGEFAGLLLGGRNELDGGLFCQIHQALLSHARHSNDRNAIIRELYWLGMGRYNMCGKMAGVGFSKSESYLSQMRLCFAEAAAYLKYYDEIDDVETKGYILRSRANTALGRFKSTNAKIQRTRQILQILQDKDYQEKTPELPWERYIYMTHQQMMSSISRNRDNDMTAQDIADIMESAHIVYERQVQEALRRKEAPPVKSAFSCATTEYCCGMISLNELLARMEEMMDAADVSDFSLESMYSVLSLPAFYAQYLREYPELLSGRSEYLEELYRKALAYMDAFPEGGKGEQLFFFLRQISGSYIETEHGVPYGEFQQKMQLRFAPDIYIHSQVVGRAASVFCGILMDEEPTFFDDIGHIKKITEPAEKKRQVLSYAMQCGAFHDVGRMDFMNLYFRTARQWFEEEYEIVKFHTVVGGGRLEAHASTYHCAAAALGHHSWYDGSHGYPDTYIRLESPYRQMVDVIGLMDWLDNQMNMAWLKGGKEETFPEALEGAIALEGRRFSPLLTARLRDEGVVAKIQQALEEGRREAYANLYKDSYRNMEGEKKDAGI